MGRYAIYKPGRAATRPPHWSDNLPSGALWADLNLQISVNLEQWAAERGIPLDQAREAFAALVDEIKDQAVSRGVEVRATVSPELSGPLI